METVPSAKYIPLIDEPSRRNRFENMSEGQVEKKTDCYAKN